MNEFINKLIERLGEYPFAFERFGNDGMGGQKVIALDDAIEIVNQLAKEYNNCSTDLVIVQSLPSLYPLQPFEEEAVHRVVGSAKDTDVQTIDVSELLGESEQGNDFCEWFNYDYRTIAPKKHDAKKPYWRIPENMDKLKYCPYCGKKIKVTPYQPKGE